MLSFKAPSSQVWPAGVLGPLCEDSPDPFLESSIFTPGNEREGRFHPDLMTLALASGKGRWGERTGFVRGNFEVGHFPDPSVVLFLCLFSWGPFSPSSHAVSCIYKAPNFGVSSNLVLQRSPCSKITSPPF